MRDASKWRHDDRFVGSTWHPLARWASYVLDRREPQPITAGVWRSVLSRIAVINVKKHPGGARARAAAIRNIIDDRYAPSSLRSNSVSIVRTSQYSWRLRRRMHGRSLRLAGVPTGTSYRALAPR